MTRRFRYDFQVVWLSCYISLVCAIMGILTLGCYVPRWDILYLMTATARWFKKEGLNEGYNNGSWNDR